MILQKSKQLLEKLRRLNYRQLPDFGMDELSEIIIRVITDECKCTVLTSDEHGNLESTRYESDIIKENLHQIVRQLIMNSGTIPKEVMNRICCTRGILVGVNSDVQLFKGIRKNEDGTAEMTATTGNSIIDFTQLSQETLEHIKKEIYDRFARQFIILNHKNLPHINRFSLFKEKVLHRNEDKKFIRKQFISILENETEYSHKIIKATVDYHLDYMFNSQFKNKIVDSVNNGKAVIKTDGRGKNISFNKLLEVVSTETGELENIIPNINEIYKDIGQVYADIEAQLIAYSTDITQLDSKQIEEKIKQIYKASFKKTELLKYTGESGYKNTRVEIKKRKDIKLVDVDKVPQCMLKLTGDIQELVQNIDSMSKEEYLKRAVQLNYRFIRIHPFVDSNGRTSRALLNMITIPKGMLISVKKEEKSMYTKAIDDTNIEIDKKGYFKALNDNSDELKQIEEENLNSPIYEFIKQNCVIDVQDITCSKSVQQSKIREQEEK